MEFAMVMETPGPGCDKRNICFVNLISGIKMGGCLDGLKRGGGGAI